MKFPSKKWTFIISELFQTFQNFFKNFRTFSNILELFQTFHSIYNYVQFHRSNCELKTDWRSGSSTVGCRNKKGGSCVCALEIDRIFVDSWMSMESGFQDWTPVSHAKKLIRPLLVGRKSVLIIFKKCDAL